MSLNSPMRTTTAEAGPVFDVVELPATDTMVVRRVVAMTDLTEFFGAAFDAVVREAEAVGATVIGPPFGWYHSMPTDTVELSAGFPIDGMVSSPSGDVVVERRPGGRAVVGTHVGPYDTMVLTYAALEAWMRERGLVPRNDMWEEYLSEPTGDPSTWLTRIVTPLLD